MIVIFAEKYDIKILSKIIKDKDGFQLFHSVLSKKFIAASLNGNKWKIKLF